MSSPWPPHVFREYDIRGEVDSEITPRFAHCLGIAFASLVKESGGNAVAVGYDCRLSSPALAEALSRGIRETGVDVVQIGMGPTPQLYFSLFHSGVAGGVQVTGSHNPLSMNGFKICLGTRSLHGDDIQALRGRMEESLLRPPTKIEPRGGERQEPLGERYISEIVDRVKPHMGPRSLRIVCDAGNGVGGLIGPAVLRAIGCTVIELFCEPDGTFPNHHPDPTVRRNLKELVARVRQTSADFGVAWDGDADRLVVVDQNGQILLGDSLLCIFARDLLKEVPKARIIGDIKCSERVFEDIRSKGGEAIMWKAGHSLIKDKMRETGALLAAETTGHLFFAHRYFGFDDALFAAARFAQLMSNGDCAVSSLLQDLPPVISTPEIRIPCDDNRKFKIAEAAKRYFSQQKISTIDGVRITFDRGWGLLRASNTQPELVLRLEADSRERFEEYSALLRQFLTQELGSSIDLQDQILEG